MQLGVVLNIQAEECKHLVYGIEVSNHRPPSAPLPLSPPDIFAAHLAGGTDPGAGRHRGITNAMQDLGM